MPPAQLVGGIHFVTLAGASDSYQNFLVCG